MISGQQNIRPAREVWIAEFFRTRLRKYQWLNHPVVAMSVLAGCFALAESFSIRHHLIDQLPIATFGQVSQELFLGQWHLDRYFGRPLANSLALRSSLMLFLISSASVIAVARRHPRHRNAATILGGTAWILFAVGWQFALGVLVVAGIIHYGFRRMNSYLAMLITCALLLILLKFFVPRPRSSVGTMASVAVGALRLIMYAFETSSVPREERSFSTVLAFSPLGLFLWPADPLMTSYLMFSTKVSREKLDNQGAAQLYRCGLKYLLMVGLVRFLVASLPPNSAVWDAGVGTFLGAFFLAPAVFYLRISLVADFAYGLASFAGFHLADAFKSPLTAENPIGFWQDWNVPVVSFLRRAFIFPLARRWPSLLLSIVAGMSGSVCVHVMLAGLRAGRLFTLKSVYWPFLHESGQYFATGLVLAVGIRFYQYSEPRKFSIRILHWIATQTAMAWLLFGTLHEICPTVAGPPAPKEQLTNAVAALMKLL